MIQKHRINTNIGRDQRVNVEINQNFDIMEILSLKFSQKDVFASGNCSEYGVVVGRVSANNGFGVPNAKISIFIPQDSIDADDPVISSLYPYQEISDKDENGYRYNLLPERQQHSGHAPTGTFPDQQDILTREEVLEVFESYYKYTVKTNDSGDFMIWGVPVGVQTIHVDIDLSDIGCFSLRPYDFLKKGYGEADFERFYQFKSSTDIDGLPQIVTFDRSIEVYPLWGNESLCEIGISRTDFDLSDKGIRIEPISLVLVSTITDDNSDAVKRNGKIRKNAGFKCNLQTSGGEIECVRQTGKTVYGSDGVTTYPELEFFNVTEVIDDNGVAMAALPMNMEYVYTDLFGEEKITNDPNKGIPTTTIARFRFSLDYSSSKISVAKYLVPNIREFNPAGNNNKREYYEGMVASYIFSDVFEDYLTPATPEGLTLNPNDYGSSAKEHKKGLMLGTIQGDGIPEDYFYKFIYGKVYTVSSFQGTHYETARRDAFLGIKQIRPASDEDCASSTNYIPTNFGYKNRTKFSLLLSQVILFIQLVFAVILVKTAELLGGFFYDVAAFFYSIYLGWPFKWRPFEKFSEQLKDLGYRIQDRFTQQLPLTIYPDCEECTTDDSSVISDSSLANNYCKTAEIEMEVTQVPGDPGYVYFRVLDSTVVSQPYPTSNYRNLGSQDSFLDYFFPEEKAKEDLGGCIAAPTLVYNEIDFRFTETITPDPGDLNTVRYFAEVFGINSVTATPIVLSGFTNFNIFFTNTIVSNGPRYVTMYHNSTPFGSNATWCKFSFQDFQDITGLDYNQAESQIDGTVAVLKIYNRGFEKTEGDAYTGQTIEVGCEKYDKTYNELGTVYRYLWGDSNEYGSPKDPLNPPGDYVGFEEAIIEPPGYPYLLSTIIGAGSTARLPYKQSWDNIPNATYDRKTKSGLSEFRDGIFTIIPVIGGTSKNMAALQEWYRRKRVGLQFCGGVVNYSFIDNWLHGLLYFFKFDKRLRWDNEEDYDLNQRGSKFPRELIFYNILDKEFYYRSTPYDWDDEEFIGQTFEGIKELLHPTTFYDVGVRDEFLDEICLDPRVDPTCSVVRDISSTSYQDPGNVVEYAINYRLDINNGKFDVDDFFSGTQYGSNIKVFDGDITQLMSINCESGIEAFDLDTPQYFMYNGEMMDPEDSTFDSYFKGGGPSFGPTPIDIKFDNNGTFIRSCLNYRLGDYSQRVPFYLWNKFGTGFGSYIPNLSDRQKWDKNPTDGVAQMRLQRLFSVSGTTTYDLDNTNYVMADGEEEYLLKPMTITHPVYWFTGDYEDSLERFEEISYSAPSSTDTYIDGDLWLQVVSGSLADPQSGYLWAVVNSTWVIQTGTGGENYFDGVYETFIPQTELNYLGNKQVLSTPFLFYFGLKPGKSSLDILTKYFGPKGAFGTDAIICPAYDVTPTPSATPAASLLPLPSPSPSPGAPPTPTPTPTLGATTNVYVYNSALTTQSILSVRVDGALVSGGSFPVLPGDWTMATTTQSGTLDVMIRLSGVAFYLESVTLEADYYSDCVDAPPSLFDFIGVPVNGNDININYDEIGC